MHNAPTRHLLPPLRRLLEPLLSHEPAAQLIRSTARQQWRLLAVNLGSSEGATLAVVFLAVQSLVRCDDEAPRHWWCDPGFAST